MAEVHRYIYSTDICLYCHLQRRLTTCDKQIEEASDNQELVLIELPNTDVQKVICASLQGSNWAFPHPDSYQYISQPMYVQSAMIMFKIDGTGNPYATGQYLAKVQQLSNYSTNDLQIIATSYKLDLWFAPGVTTGLLNGLNFQGHDIAYINEDMNGNSRLMFDPVPWDVCTTFTDTFWMVCENMFSYLTAETPVAEITELNEAVFIPLFALFGGGGAACASHHDPVLKCGVLGYPV